MRTVDFSTFNSIFLIVLLQKSLVTATNTRRKQQQEMVAKALVAEECKKREARESFPLSTIAVSIQASQEFTQTTSQQDVDESE